MFPVAQGKYIWVGIDTGRGIPFPQGVSDGNGEGGFFLIKKMFRKSFILPFSLSYD